MSSIDADIGELGSITKWRSGGTPDRSRGDYWSGSIPWISAGTLKTFQISDSDQHLTETAIRFGSQLALPGAILLLVRGMAVHKEVRAGVVTHPVAFNQDVKALLPKKNLRPRFLAYSLLARKAEILGLVTSAGSGTGVLETKALRRLRLWIPDVIEQDRIVAILDDHSRHIDTFEGLITKKEDIKRGLMQELLGGRTRLPGFHSDWKGRQMGALGDTFGGLTGKTKADFGQGSSRYVPFMAVMTDVRVGPASLLAVQVRQSEGQTAIKDGDILFNTSSETPEELAMASVATDLPEGTFLNSFCFGMRIRPASQVAPLFLAYLFRSELGRKELRVLAQGATRYNLSRAKFRQITILLPPRDEQVAIVGVLADADAEIAVLRARLAKASEIKQGLMQQLLTGRTRLPAGPEELAA